MPDAPHAPIDGYSNADLATASAMLADVYASLRLAPGDGMVLAVDPSAEATLAERAAKHLGLRVRRLAHSSGREAVAAALGDVPPRLLVCRPSDFTWLSRAAFRAGVGWVFTLGTDRTGSLLERAVRVRGP